MAIIQAILTLISRSLGRILSAVFGWAVVALFGETGPTTKLWLSALVGAAAAWPILVAGIVAPRLAALVLAFVPLPRWIPDWSVRSAWILLALAVPLAVGLVMATRRSARFAPTSARAELGARTAGAPAREPSGLGRLIRGFPITLGLSAAFFIVFVTVPALRVVSFGRRRIDLHVPLVTEADAYEAVAGQLARTLSANGFEVTSATPPWWMTAPSRILRWADPASFDAYVPRRFAYYRGPQLEAAVYPNEVLLRGPAQEVAWAQGVLVEALTASPALQTFDPEAQAIEKQIRRVWQVYQQNPAAHRRARVLSARLMEIAEQIRRLPVPYDEWQIVYRQALQLGRALGGEPQLLQRAVPTAEMEDIMNDPVVDDDAFATPTAKARAAYARQLSTRELLTEITGNVSLLVKKEVELVKAEAKADLVAELGMLKAIAAGALAGLLGLNALLVAVIVALATQMPAWLAAVVVGGVLLLVAAALGSLGWSRRVTVPLAVTRKTVKEDVQWAKERVA